MDQNVTVDLKAAISKTFSNMFALEIQGAFETAHAFPQGDITAIIEMGPPENPVAILAVIFPKETAFKILKSIYQKDFTEIDSKVSGAIGEVTNVIYGVLKFRLADRGIELGLALPKVTTGPAPVVTGAQWMFTGDFQTRNGPFQVGIAKRSN
jgi:CheY-specific phosphatase CheX